MVVLSSVGDGDALAARSTVWRSVDDCRSSHTTTTGDATSSTAADNRRHRTVVFRQTHHSREVRGRRGQPAGNESDEHRPTLRCQRLAAINVRCSRFIVRRRSHIVVNDYYTHKMRLLRCPKEDLRFCCCAFWHPDSSLPDGRAVLTKCIPEVWSWGRAGIIDSDSDISPIPLLIFTES